MLKVLYVTSEAEPFIKVGELSTTGYTLPAALKEQNVDVRVVMPKYRNIKSTYRRSMGQIYSGEVDIAWRKKYMGVQQYNYQGIPYYFIDSRDYFYRDNCYGYNDELERFTFFCRAVLEMLPKIDFWPDIIHINDWRTALVSIFLKLDYTKSPDERYKKIKTVFTIHDLQEQGRFWKGYLPDILGLDWQYFNNKDLEFYDDINLMKAAMLYSDKIINLSHEHFGNGLEGVLKKRSLDVSDIVEGIDYDLYNPQTDTYIKHKYSVQEALIRRADNKEALQEKLKLTVNRNIPIIALMSPLVKGKGIGLITKVIGHILEYEQVQFICVGKGKQRYESWFKQLVWCYPQKAAVYIANENEEIELRHQIYASADIILSAMRYQPYEKQQCIALRYGAVPLVSSDSRIVQSFDKYTHIGNGFVFKKYSAHDLLSTLRLALSSLIEYNIHQRIIANGMNEDYSWQNTAKEYIALYKQVKMPSGIK